MEIVNHLELVKEVKARLDAQHEDLSGACGAFKITLNTAWILRAEGAGILYKGLGGFNCNGYSTDAIIYPDGTHYDVLQNSGIDNIPNWRLVTIEGTDEPFLRPNDYRPPYEPNMPNELEARVKELEYKVSNLEGVIKSLKKIALRAHNGKIVSAWDTFFGQNPLIANRDNAGIGEEFEIIPRG